MKCERKIDPCTQERDTAMDVYLRMKELGIQLPEVPQAGGLYAPANEFGPNLVYISGCGPEVPDPVCGKLGQEFTVEQGQVFARNCMLNALAVLQAHIGDLNRVQKAVKILTFVASTPDFHDQPAVANGGSQLLLDIFGKEAGLAARSAVGAVSLPDNIPVETEVLFQLQA